MSAPPIGLALGSGGVRGFALFPVIRRLEAEGIPIAAVSGSSIGALVGAYYALHGEVESLWKISTGLTRSDYLKLADPNNPARSLFKGRKIRTFLKERYFGDRTFAETRIPLSVCAVDLNTHQPVYIEDGTIIDAVLASISIPGVVPPYGFGDRLFIDGGVLDPVPVKPLLDRGLPKIVAVNLMGYRPGPRRKNRLRPPEIGIRENLITTFYLMMSRLSHHDGNDRIFDLTLKFPPDPANALTFTKWKPYAAVGEKTIARKMPALRNWLADGRDCIPLANVVIMGKDDIRSDSR